MALLALERERWNMWSLQILWVALTQTFLRDRYGINTCRGETMYLCVCACGLGRCYRYHLLYCVQFCSREWHFNKCLLLYEETTDMHIYLNVLFARFSCEVLLPRVPLLCVQIAGEATKHCLKFHFLLFCLRKRFKNVVLLWLLIEYIVALPYVWLSLKPTFMWK